MKKKVVLTKIIWEIKGVKEVVNKVQISDMSNIKNLARDVASVGEIRARMLTNININSLNFSVDVVNDIAYLSGIAASEEEINIVTEIAKKARCKGHAQSSCAQFLANSTPQNARKPLFLL